MDTSFGNKHFCFSFFNKSVFLKAVDGKGTSQITLKDFIWKKACTEAFCWQSTSNEGKTSLDSYFLFLRNHLWVRTFLSEASDYEDFIAVESNAVCIYTRHCESL